MEGPTPSSAIFYGSLSAHLGVFLLMRTHNFWENQLTTRILIGAGGFSTAVAGFFIARVQSTIKTQIAWASIGQIGIMFVEISLGLYTLALIHFAGNAFLRTYQLLVSPSVVAYLIREQFYHFKPQQFAYRKSIRSRLRYTLYMLSIKEWGLDKLMTRLAFNPMKKVGRFLDFLKPRNVLFFFVQLYLSGLFLHSHEEKLNESVRHLLPVAFSLVGLIFVLKAFSERKYPRLSLMLIMMNGFWVALAISFNEHYEFSHTLFYLSGIVASGLTGMIALEYLRRREPDYFSLSQYYGHVYEYPRLSLVVLLSCLGIMGFPITTTFIGEDLIFSHIHDDQFLLAAVNSLAFVVDGLAVIKIYTRLFLGPHAKTYHSTALKSA